MQIFAVIEDVHRRYGTDNGPRRLSCSVPETEAGYLDGNARERIVVLRRVGFGRILPALPMRRSRPRCRVLRLPSWHAETSESINDCTVLERALQRYRRPNSDRLWG